MILRSDYYLSIHSGRMYYPGHHDFPSSPPPPPQRLGAALRRCPEAAGVSHPDEAKLLWSLPGSAGAACCGSQCAGAVRSPKVEPWDVWRDIQGGCAVQFSGFSLVIHGMSNVSPNYSFCWGSLSLVMAFLGFRKLSLWRFGTYWCSLFSRRLWLCETTVQQKTNHQDLFYSSTVFFLSMFIPLPYNITFSGLRETFAGYTLAFGGKHPWVSCKRSLLQIHWKHESIRKKQTHQDLCPKSSTGFHHPQFFLPWSTPQELSMAAWSVAGFGGDDAKAMLRVLQVLGEARQHAESSYGWGLEIAAPES